MTAVDVQIKVPHGTTGLQWATLARDIGPETAELIEEVCLFETRQVAATDGPTRGLSHPVPEHDGRYCVWMQHPVVVNNKRPWGRIADGLTAEHVAAFSSAPSPLLSIQRSRIGE